MMPEFVSSLLERILNVFTSEMINIPAIQPIVDRLMEIPLVNLIVAFLLWKPIFHIVFFPGLVGIMLVLLWIVYFERKLTARVQWRVGPKEVSRRTGGILQTLADGMRYFFQEAIVHRGADKFYFMQFPLLSFLPVLLPILFIPAGGSYGIDTPYAIPIAVALISLIPVFIMGMGWASNNKFAFIGTVREAFLYVAYELPFILAVASMLLIYQTPNPFEIVAKQTIPGIFLNPIAFLVFLITTLIATGRLPFDIAEADQEIAFGPYVEYSGILFGLVMTVPYEKLYILSMLMTLLFFGGWNGPYIAPLGEFSYVLWFYIKTFVIVSVIALARSIYARYRLDQTLRLGWSILFSLSLISLLISAGWAAW
ncbi:respiratory-chain NADH dehydrogenase subunit 1 [Ferroglobus placidus DSM 10642]|uniref:Respiratory-chain NADH dehydrogenase subunit 1 n=1 Tax=Ferroglobus placidus (strain DSM 10642 / AEDII12DO) TaxID=589924 RepID=D3RZE2_FERPA|nr:NADH-quinone oxidoreductase subunit NuoH [Ferroglobus placidus]ADC65855.1 respiratory-chain NADH dehydrogenase subunit 1 [Ferroglobus placidus DSM 10642]